MMTLDSSFRWQTISGAITLLVVFPILTLLLLSLQGDVQIWQHLSDTLLLSYVLGSVKLLAGVLCLALPIGVGSAWITSQYNFFGKRVLTWALLLPMAMPAYIVAYSYTGLLDVAGPVQTVLRDTFNLSYGDYWFPEIRSEQGAMFVIAFVLYPYIYLLSRASFIEQSQNLRNAATLFGYSPLKSFLLISLPIARPAIIAGAALVAMETLADYGTVSYFGVQTFTTGIFRTWYGLGSIQTAAQLALMLLAFAVCALYFEQQSRRKAYFYEASRTSKHQPIQLNGIAAALAVLICVIPLLIGFVIPNTQLVIWAVQHSSEIINAKFWQLVGNTLLLGFIATSAALVLAVLLSYAKRLTQNRFTHLCFQISSWGYAIPGIVIAVGILTPLANFDNALDAMLSQHFGISTGLLLSGSVVALILAYLVRFLAVSLHAVNSGLEKVSPEMDRASRLLGSSSLSTLRKIHIPILKSSLLTALILVFVDVMKELPATLVLRPFDFNTLAVKAYELAADEQLAQAAMPSLAIVLAGIIPVVLLMRMSDKST
jgi:iron(III) transport system permease protein